MFAHIEDSPQDRLMSLPGPHFLSYEMLGEGSRQQTMPGEPSRTPGARPGFYFRFVKRVEA